VSESLPVFNSSIQRLYVVVSRSVQDFLNEIELFLVAENPTRSPDRNIDVGSGLVINSCPRMIATTDAPVLGPQVPLGQRLSYQRVVGRQPHPDYSYIVADAHQDGSFFSCNVRRGCYIIFGIPYKHTS